MKYKRFEKTWNQKMSIYKQRMLAFENSHDQDIRYDDIILRGVDSSASVTTEFFWVEIHIDLNIEFDPETMDGDEESTIETLYRISFIDDRLVLEHDRFGDGFDEIWNTPGIIESDLLRSLINDMLEIEPKCMISLDDTQMDIMLSDEFNYIDFELIDNASRVLYFDKFKKEVFLPSEAKDIFIF